MKVLLDLFSFAIPMIILSWILPKKYVLLSQIVITGLFILYKSPLSFCVLTFVSFGNFYVLHQSNFRESIKIAISLVFLIFLIFTTKILFSVDKDWIVPLGMSYYSFRNIHYTLEYYKGKIKNEKLLFYLAYNFFLPVFIIGPINRYPDFVKDWQRRRFDNYYFSTGLQRILYGTSKIVILGNYLFTLKAVNFIENIDKNHEWLKTYLETLRFVFNAYFQFAGYSDIAIGLSLLMGYRIVENFNYPFLATNMRDFWAKYHISLSSFCKDYIYTPISSYYRKPLFGIIATMIIIGLWHEISLRYLLWGLLQALGIYISSFFQNKTKSIIMSTLGSLFVINFFALSCIIISHDTLSSALETYKTLFLIH
ncbi:MBOAT family O-acyltransferase [Flavobacterium sp. PL002]